MDVNVQRLATNLAAVRERVAHAAERSGRSADDVLVVAVSKTFPVHVVRDAIEAGVTDLGENRAQELKEKHAVLGERVRWHFIGNLQTNKVRSVVGKAILIHSVGRFGLAEAISRRATSIGVQQAVLLEVNIAGEPTKHGCDPGHASHLAAEIAALPGIELRGVMAMAPFSDEPEDSREHFIALREISETITASHPAATEISMGMTRDLEVAVEEGSTVVRVGEAIFGPRTR